MMSLRQKFPLRLQLLGLAILLVAAASLFVRHSGSRPTAAAGGASPESAAVPDRPDRAPGNRARPGPGGSQAVAALVGNSALSDAQVIAGLQRLVDDAGRKLDERLEALEHLLNLVPQDDPTPLRDLASRRVMPNEVRSRLLADTLNRPRRLQGELLVMLLENAAGDARAEVLGELRGLCDQDLGDDPGAWRKAVEAMPSEP